MGIVRNLIAGSDFGVSHRYGTLRVGEPVYSVAVDGTTGEPEHHTGTLLAVKDVKVTGGQGVVIRNDVGRVTRLWVTSRYTASSSKDFLLTVVILEGQTVKGYIAKDLKVYAGTSVNLVDKEQPIHLSSDAEMKIHAHVKYDDGSTVSGPITVFYASCISEIISNNTDAT
jgi:hypothetical protein